MTQVQGTNQISSVPISSLRTSSAANAGAVAAPAYPGFWQAIILIMLLMILQILLTIPFLVVGLSRHPAALAMPTLIGTTVAVVYGFSRNFARTGERFREVFPLTAISGSMLLKLLMTVAGLLILNLQLTRFVVWLIPPPKFFARFIAETLRGQWPLELFLTVAIIVPLGEEFFFRGLLLHAFLSRYGAFKAIIASALLFAFMHGNPWQLTTGISLGIIFGWCVVRTHSLIPCFFGHFANNTIAFLLPRLQLLMPDTAKWIPSHPGLMSAVGFLFAASGIYMLKKSFAHASLVAGEALRESEACLPSEFKAPDDAKEN